MCRELEQAGLGSRTFHKETKTGEETAEAAWTGKNPKLVTGKWVREPWFLFTAGGGVWRRCCCAHALWRADLYFKLILIKHRREMLGKSCPFSLYAFPLQLMLLLSLPFSHFSKSKCFYQLCCLQNEGKYFFFPDCFFPEQSFLGGKSEKQLC